MKSIQQLIKSAITAIVTFAAAITPLTLLAADNTATGTASSDQSEKCYGIVKAGMNDCQSSSQSCAGSATKDSQPDTFILMPTGLCSKIVGGSLTLKKG